MSKEELSPAKSISDLVGDWGGFEQLVAQLNETGDVVVEHNVILPGRSGASRQVDVLIRHKQGLYEHLVVCECKYWNSPVDRLHVDALATTIREVGASRGVIFSAHGFQSGAVAQAEHEHIALFKVRQFTDEEWGAPGRHVEIWMQFVSTAIGNIQMPGLLGDESALTNPPRLELRYGGADDTSTPIQVAGKPDATLEALLQRMAAETAKVAYTPARLNFEGKADGEARAVVKVNFAPKEPALLFVDGAVFVVPRIEFDLGVKVTQSLLQIDRAQPYAFILAVEDCVGKTKTTASRRKDAEKTVLHGAVAEDESPEENFQSGTVITVWLGLSESFDDFSTMPPRPVSAGSATLTL